MTHPPAPQQGMDDHELAPDRLIELYRLMVMARTVDRRMWTLNRQGRIPFVISGQGHEATQLAIAASLRPGQDWVVPYYRDLALCIGMGMTPREFMLALFARQEDPSSGGRQMPSHFSLPRARIVTTSSTVATQVIHAAGIAYASRVQGLDEVTVTCLGEGSTSEGDWHEGLNFAAVHRLPMICVVQDNDYAISVPHRLQMGVESVARRAAGYGMAGEAVDGRDLLTVYRVMKVAVERARSGQGPTLVAAKVTRLTSHSSDDDQRRYRPADELAHLTDLEPLERFRAHLHQRSILTEELATRIHKECEEEVEAAVEYAESAPEPDPAEIGRHVYAEPPPPSLPHEGGGNGGEIRTYIEGIREAMAEEMERDHRVWVLGEDVGRKGGVFLVTEGLQARFGEQRVLDTPLAESCIVGVAIGSAFNGMLPVAEIQFADFIHPAFDQIVSEAARIRYRSHGGWGCGIVIRVPYGGGVHGALYHSQSVEAFYAHVPGLKVVIPSTPADAKGLLKAAVRDPDPVLFLEHKRSYRLIKGAIPPGDHVVPIGPAAIRRPGTKLSTFAWGLMVHHCLEAAAELDREGISVEVVDLRTLRPLDRETVLESVRRTGKALIVHEDNLTGGFGAEVAAIIAEEAFDHLDGPVMRVAGPDVPAMPFNHPQEAAFIPDPARIAASMRRLAAY